ncbi:hypothetical protein TRIATDRAFT_159748 [Trichoderma atroviride IMI 206040]|uniref:Uncharacterized protein n=1 Tax=Hypocrea atroviridis (strain ATCC 20476 / IMI 206040) TaxID=452589 RepID=G9NGN4_HYPAI|nr:uncharacterized protein TRIATDRAFT_159748 [Trichoderma atroviride IMI 206040]EHK50445.1 hypothetical protein TRIATDRAFT_159748 [Trichoderma atroviride IMI 206040]
MCGQKNLDAAVYKRQEPVCLKRASTFCVSSSHKARERKEIQTNLPVTVEQARRTLVESNQYPQWT